MDLGKPLIEYGAVDVSDILSKLPSLPEDYWVEDRASRVKLAGNRPGNAVFLYNDAPSFISRHTLPEAQSGVVNVLRYPNKGLFPDCDVMRVQLAELPPGQVISPHRDLGILAVIHRLHVPLVTHELVKFMIQRQFFNLKVGHLYDLNNAVVHGVENKSDVMRIHLMVDMLPRRLARAVYHDTEADMAKAVGMTATA